MEAKQNAVIALHLDKKTPIQIVRSLKHLKVNERFVYRVIKRYKETGSVDDRPRSGRPKSARTQETVEKVKEEIRQNPGRSAREMAKELDISSSSMQLLLKKDIGLNSCKQQNVHELTATDINKIGRTNSQSRQKVVTSSESD